MIGMGELANAVKDLKDELRDDIGGVESTGRPLLFEAGEFKKDSGPRILYKVYTSGAGKYLVLAFNPLEAQQKVENFLNGESFWAHQKLVIKIKRVADEESGSLIL